MLAESHPLNHLKPGTDASIAKPSDVGTVTEARGRGTSPPAASVQAGRWPRRQAWRERVRLDRNELAGAFGDIGTDLPLILAMIVTAGLDPSSVLVLFGAAQIVTGFLYGLPMPLQPLKVMAMLVISQKLDGPTLYGGGLAVGLAMLALTMSGATGWLSRSIPRAVVRGLQLGLGLSLASLALKQYVPADGPWGYVLAAVCFGLAVVLWGNRRLPAAIPIMLIGGVYALLWRVSPAEIVGGVGLELPGFRALTWEHLWAGWWLLALPQLPLSISNSVIATQRTVTDLYPERGVTVRKIGLTYSACNLILPWLGGIPVCHGCGGLAGHHAFGGRTGGSVVIYGSMYLTAGLFFSGSLGELARLFPMPVLGAVLVVESLSLMRLVRDCLASVRELTVALLVAVTASGLPHGFLVGMLLGCAVWWLSARWGMLGEVQRA